MLSNSTPDKVESLAPQVDPAFLGPNEDSNDRFTPTVIETDLGKQAKQSKPGNTNENKNNASWSIRPKDWGCILLCISGLLYCIGMLFFQRPSNRPGIKIVGAVTRPLDTFEPDEPPGLDSDSRGNSGGDFGGMM